MFAVLSILCRSPPRGSLKSSSPGVAMSSLHSYRPLLAVAIAVGLSSCAAAPPPATRNLTVLNSVTSDILSFPVTTASADARNHFLEGQREVDLVRPFEAIEHFKRAVTADSTFAFAYLGIANTSNSLAEFKANLERAERFAAGASDAERLQIQIARRGFENDASGQLTLAKELVAKYPNSARAYEILGQIQQGVNQTGEARASCGKALSLSPRFLLAHTDLGTSFLFNEPRDFDRGLRHYQTAESLAPDEPAMHDFL